MIRNPVVAGQFYEQNQDKLLRQIKDAFLSVRGPRELPNKNRKGQIKGIISPHAGYAYSGACASHGYKALAEAEAADLYIILGPSHNGFHKSCYSEDDWDTPLGLLDSDDDFGHILGDDLIDLIPFPHKEEHSIEVQLPFLQFACDDIKKDLKFMPIIISEIDYEETAKDLIKAIKEYEKKGKKIIIIASSDFTHYGASYGYVPFEKKVKDSMYNLDKAAIDLILKLDSDGFLNYCEKTRATICGKYPIYVMIEIMKAKKAKAELLQYYTSADIAGDYASAVGYASILFK
jgi:hypothetical protein